MEDVVYVSNQCQSGVTLGQELKFSLLPINTPVIIIARKNAPIIYSFLDLFRSFGDEGEGGAHGYKRGSHSDLS